MPFKSLFSLWELISIMRRESIITTAGLLWVRTICWSLCEGLSTYLMAEPIQLHSKETPTKPFKVGEDASHEELRSGQFAFWLIKTPMFLPLQMSFTVPSVSQLRFPKAINSPQMSSFVCSVFFCFGSQLGQRGLEAFPVTWEHPVCHFAILKFSLL